MIKGLKVVMIVWAAIGILLGLAHIFFPSQLADWIGLEKGPVYMHWVCLIMGVCLILPSVFIILAAVRDPLKNIMWVQLATAWAVLMVVVDAYSIGRGFVTFSQEGMGLIIDAAFAVAFLALYPYRAAQK